MSSWNPKLAQKLTKDIYNAYNYPEKPNEYLIFQRIAEILSQTSDSTKDLSAFIVGMSRDYASFRKDNQHFFNMFIDFAYAGSFNYFDIPLRCLTKKALNLFRKFAVVDNSYRAFSFSIILKKNETNLSQEKFWGDEKSIRYRLHYGKRKNFNIFNGEEIQSSKLHFKAPFEKKKPVLNVFEDGEFGTSSRFNLLVHRLSEIIQPQLSVNSISYSDDTKLDFWFDDSKSIENQPSLLKSKEGHLKVSMSVKGCLEGYELWTQSGVKLSPQMSEFIPDSHSYLIDVLLPLDLMENPFDSGNKFEPSSALNISPPDKPMNQNKIPLTIMMDRNTENLQSIKLNLKCLLKDLDISKMAKFYPQSHLVKGFMDPGYFGFNFISEKIEFKNVNNIFQLTIQDISKLEDRQLIRQTFLSSIEIISDFDLFFDTNDSISKENIINFRMKNESEMFEIGEEEPRMHSQPKEPLKLLHFSEKDMKIHFHKNLEMLATYWDIEFTSFADIGCCTTGTLGKTVLRITKRDRPFDKVEPAEREEVIGHHKLLFGKLVNLKTSKTSSFRILTESFSNTSFLRE